MPAATVIPVLVQTPPAPAPLQFPEEQVSATEEPLPISNRSALTVDRFPVLSATPLHSSVTVSEALAITVEGVKKHVEIVGVALVIVRDGLFEPTVPFAFVAVTDRMCPEFCGVDP